MLRTIRVGVRYGMNLSARVASQSGYRAGAVALGKFVLSEAAKLPRFAQLVALRRVRSGAPDVHPPLYSDEILGALTGLGLEMKSYRIDVEAFAAHVSTCRYPRNYAGGPLGEGGAREEKLLEYFVSLDLLNVRPSDVVVDVASEWSVFPEVVRRLSGATLYRQDLIYGEGTRDDRIGGSAARMPVPGGFADKLVLHNAFEHFEGTADTEFIAEAWRVLKPGGMLCILPLNVSDRYSILTDPLVGRRGIVWDEGARIVELPWWHNRFGRLYDAAALDRRVLTPGAALGFHPTVYHVLNVHEVHPRAYLHFALTMRKPQNEQQPQEHSGGVSRTLLAEWEDRGLRVVRRTLPQLPPSQRPFR